MKRLMAGYQGFLKQQGFEGLGIHAAVHPQAETNGRFVGSKACEDCHKGSYKTWKKTAHAAAYATLANLDPPRNFDPECISCHVVGWHPTKFFPYVSGYESARRRRTWRTWAARTATGRASCTRGPRSPPRGRRPTRSCRRKCKRRWSSPRPRPPIRTPAGSAAPVTTATTARPSTSRSIGRSSSTTTETGRGVERRGGSFLTGGVHRKPTDCGRWELSRSTAFTPPPVGFVGCGPCPPYNSQFINGSLTSAGFASTGPGTTILANSCVSSRPLSSTARRVSFSCFVPQPS